MRFPTIQEKKRGKLWCVGFRPEKNLVALPPPSHWKVAIVANPVSNSLFCFSQEEFPGNVLAAESDVKCGERRNVSKTLLRP